MKEKYDYFYGMWKAKTLPEYHEAFSPLLKDINVEQYGFYLLQNGVNFENSYLISGYYDVDEISHSLDKDFNFNLKLQIRKNMGEKSAPSYFPIILPLKKKTDHKSAETWNSIFINYSNTRILGLKWCIFGLSELLCDELRDLFNIRMGELAYASCKLEKCLENHLKQQDTSNPPQLTLRQMQVLKMTVSCSYRKEVASKLGISVVTVAKHLDKIAEILGVKNRREIIEAAMKCGILPIYDQFDNQ